MVVRFIISFHIGENDNKEPTTLKTKAPIESRHRIGLSLMDTEEPNTNYIYIYIYIYSSWTCFTVLYSFLGKGGWISRAFEVSISLIKSIHFLCSQEFFFHPSIETV